MANPIVFGIDLAQEERVIDISHMDREELRTVLKQLRSESFEVELRTNAMYAKGDSGRTKFVGAGRRVTQWRLPTDEELAGEFFDCAFMIHKSVLLEWGLNPHPRLEWIGWMPNREEKEVLLLVATRSRRPQHG